MPPLADLAEHHRVGHEDLVQDDLVEVVLTGEQVDRADRHAGGVERDDELGESGMPVGGVEGSRANQGEEGVRVVRTAGPDLRARDQPAPVGADPLRPDGGEVGAGVGLAHPDAK